MLLWHGARVQITANRKHVKKAYSQRGVIIVKHRKNLHPKNVHLPLGAVSQSVRMGFFESKAFHQINHQPSTSTIKHQTSSINHQSPTTKHQPIIRRQSPNISHQDQSTKHQASITKHRSIIRHQPPITNHPAPANHRINHRTCSCKIRSPRRCRHTATARRATAGPGPDVPGRPPESGSEGPPECRSTGKTRNNAEFRGPRCGMRAVRRRGSVT